MNTPLCGIIESSNNAKSPRVISTGDMAQSKGDSTMLPQYTPTDKDIQRFWSKVNRIDNFLDCWEWQGTLDGHGYGVININRLHLRAHRVSWSLVHGEIPNGLHVLHHCDNPKCVNPAHLFLGTHLDNMRDKKMKKRCRPKRNQTNARSKLTIEQVIALREEYQKGNVTQRELAKKYGVGQMQICRILRNEQWKQEFLD